MDIPSGSAAASPGSNMAETTDGMKASTPSSAVGTASSTSGNRMAGGGSWAATPAPGVCAFHRGGPRNARSQARVAYAPVTKTVSSPASSTSHAAQVGAGPPSNAAPSAADSTDSLEKNPDSGGSPTSAASPMVPTAYVSGIRRRSPPMPDSIVVPIA